MKVLVATLLISGNLAAHSGRTDSSGCHNDRRNGTYHCHRSEDIEKTKREPASTNKNNIIRTKHRSSKSSLK